MARAFTNLAEETLIIENADLEDFDGNCGELCDATLQLFGGDVLYIEPKGRHGVPLEPTGLAVGETWSYHMVPLIDGHVHDAWLPGAIMKVPEYVKTMFPGHDVQLSINGEDVPKGYVWP
jgi:hypothetical protein